MYLTTPGEAKRLIDTDDPRVAPGLRGVFPIWWAFIRDGRADTSAAD